MDYILNIDTSLSKAMVSLSAGGKIVQLAINENQRDHATFLHPAIKRLMHQENLEMKDLSGIAIAIGPGSYTGIRVGMATAKGLCFALNIPLIPIDNLFLLAATCKSEIKDAKQVICSMIDARRMEVFTASYNSNLELIDEPHSLILNESSFAENIANNDIIFCGNGVEKLQNFHSLSDSFFIKSDDTSEAFSLNSYILFKAHKFGNLKNVKPFYMKDFYNG